jgi:predicted Zn finger-like uncharacterized protein
MPVVITCPACQRKARVPDSALGKTVKCPGCSTTFPAMFDDSLPPQATHSVEVEEAADSPPVRPALDGDARRIERTGVGVLTISQGLLAVSLALQLIVALIQLAAADSGPKAPALAGVNNRPGGTFVETFSECLTVVWVLAQVGAIVTAVVGAAYCLVPPVALSIRAAAGAMLALAAVGAILSANSIGEMFRGFMGAAPGVGMGRGVRGLDAMTSAAAGQVLVMSITPLLLGAALQSMLALVARAHARRLRDRSVASLAGGLAVAYPAAILAIFLLVVLAGIFGSQAHPTFDQVMMVLDRLFRTAFVAAGAFVLWRVWTRL